MAGAGGVLAAESAAPDASVSAFDTLPPLANTSPGDAQRGRAIVANRQQGLCLLCHSAPIAEERFQGNLAPPLDGAGSRWTAAQLRLRVADPRRLNPGSLMPSFHALPDTATQERQRVGQAWRDQPLLTTQQVEDVVAYLLTLK